LPTTLDVPTWWSLCKKFSFQKHDQSPHIQAASSCQSGLCNRCVRTAFLLAIYAICLCLLRQSQSHLVMAHAAKECEEVDHGHICSSPLIRTAPACPGTRVSAALQLFTHTKAHRLILGALPTQEPRPDRRYGLCARACLNRHRGPGPRRSTPRGVSGRMRPHGRTDRVRQGAHAGRGKQHTKKRIWRAGLLGGSYLWSKAGTGMWHQHCYLLCGGITSCRVNACFAC
jgi:hypothetical protein